MLNRVILMGRITHDLEIKQTQSGTSCLRFRIAVDRHSKNGDDNQADFITCVAWGQRAEFINRYFSKGRMIAIEGNIKTGSYDDKNGTKHYTTEVWIENVSFTGEKAQDNNGYSNNYSNQNNNYQQNNNCNQPPGNNPGNISDIGDLSDFEEVLSDDSVPF